MIRNSPTVMKVSYRWVVVALCALIAGCGVVNRKNTDVYIDHYHSTKDVIRLGMSIQSFNALMAPYEKALEGTRYVRKSDRFTRGGSIFDVVYVRSQRVSDGEDTDDEFTPHIFVDGRLAAIGWEAIGGQRRTSYDVAQDAATERAQREQQRGQQAAACASAGGTWWGTFCQSKSEPVEITPIQPVGNSSVTCTTIGNTTTCR